MSLSVPEIAMVLVIVLLIFGAGKLPAIGDALGLSIKNFKRSATGDNEIEVSKAREVGAGGKVEALAAGEDDEAEVVSKKKKAAVADEE